MPKKWDNGNSQEVWGLINQETSTMHIYHVTFSEIMCFVLYAQQILQTLNKIVDLLFYCNANRIS